MNRAALAVVAGLMLAQAGEAQSPRVRVINGEGWTIQNRKLARGALLAAGAELGARTAEPLLLECPDGLVSYSCRTGGCKVAACESSGPGVTVKRIPAPLLSSAAGLTGRVVDFLLARQPTETIIAASRAGGNPGDAVLLMDDRGVHWGPALTRVLEGRHCFRIAALPVRMSTVATFSLDWDRDTDMEAARAVPGISPGLYTLEKGREGARCEADPDATPAWVLISTAGEFGRVNDAWRSRASTIAQLEADDFEISIVRTLRHAVLAGLAEPR